MKYWIFQNYFDIFLSLQKEDITTDEVLTAAGLAAGLTPEAVAEAKEHASQPAIKEQLRAHTEEATKHGVSPFFLYVARWVGNADLH